MFRYFNGLKTQTKNLHFIRAMSSSSTNTPYTLATDQLSAWSSEIKADKLSSLAATVLRNNDIEQSLIDRDQKIAMDNGVFSHVIEKEGSPITDQKASGRCWLFAGTNVFRTSIQAKHKIESFQLSPSFLFFYDKLEKANYFLDQMVQTADEKVDSQIVQHLLTDPICDGGQYGMFVNIIEKYGLVPNTIFPDTYNTLKSAPMNQVILTLLRQYGQELREAVANGKDVQPLKESQMKEVHRLLVLFLGSPPGPNDSFDWEYTDSDKKFHRITTTPLKFFKEFVSNDISEAVSLVNDPRNPYDKPIRISKLGNVVGKPDVQYLNIDVDEMADLAIKKIKNNEPVFFGTHTPVYHDNTTGIIDTKLWNYDLIGFSPEQNKADRLRYHQSLMTHAMTFTGVHLDEAGKPIKWKVENSWGEEKGRKGYYTLSHDYFKEYVYQIVVQKSDIPDKVALLDAEPIVLPPWDPCGALAKN